MSSEARQTCARTDAVLAVHLDGDLWPTARDRETFGYAFVSDDSLHAHLRDCATCQQALQRSRRLDAALASTAGRELSQHDDLEALGDRLLQRAFAAARAPTGTDGSAGDAVRGPADGPATAASGASEALLVGDRSGDSWPATWLAAGMLAAAAAATWLCLGTPRASEDRDAAPTRRAPTEHTAHAPQVDSPPPVSPMPVSPRPATATADPDAPPLSLARRMHAAEREDAANAADDAAPGQQSLSLHELAQRIARRELGVPERLAAAERLIRRTRPGSSEVREATGRLLAALASCGDDDDHELLLHEQLLDVVRDDGPLLVRLEHRLASIRGELDRDEQSAMLVAARVGTPRLDLALRRVVRRNPEAAELVAAALRCGVRVDGAPELLLDCWHDLAALGKQAHSQREASFWFQGQAA
ncbi:MAG: hypothetical protein KAI24_22270, partial [Planctomycetes bacterium]|nr:hypothetical protein [Planctomycetota bacterium]